MRPQYLEDSHSHSQISRVFENEGSVWVRELARATLEISQSLRTRTRAIVLRIFEDSRKTLKNWPLCYQNEQGHRKVSKTGGAHSVRP